MGEDYSSPISLKEILMKIGVIGAGAIVGGFLEAQKKIDSLVIKTICGLVNDKQTMESFASDYGISKIVYDYQEVINDPDIDTVYIAVPNIYHYPYAKLALEMGKNVFIEKPITVNDQQLVELINIASEKKLFVFEGVTNLYQDSYAKLQQWIKNIGKIKIVSVNYTVFSKRYLAFRDSTKIYPCFNKKTGGGIMMDMGVYAINFVVGLFGSPIAQHYYANIEKGIDTSGTIILEYEEFICTLVISKDSRANSKISIQGVDGVIDSASAVNDIKDLTLTLYKGYEMIDQNKYILKDESSHLLSEIKYFAEMVYNKDYEKRDKCMKHSLQVMKIVTHCLKDIGIEY